MVRAGRGSGRLPWEEVWKTGDATSYEECVADLPTFIRKKNDPVHCTLNHVDRNEDELAMEWHEMRCILTECKSYRCKSAGVVCRCRYKILECTKVDLKILFVQGDHVMANDAPPSPTSTTDLTDAAKDYIIALLEDKPSIVPQLIYAFVCREITNHRIQGPTPALKKVQNFVKMWRSKNKADSMAPVIEMCKNKMYDGGIGTDLSGDSLIVLCDTKDVDGVVEPAIGTGSEANPFRIGLTCMDLLQRYADVQRNSDLTTMLHLDSTHSVVKQKYPVFVVGISDRSGSFLPIVYFCTSQRREVDISWCLALMKRVMLEQFDLQFSPDFIMMDADHAQYNACAAELQESTILMCWFHIMQNVFKHVRDNKLAAVSAQLIFRNMYDLHFAKSEQEFVQKRDFVLRSWKAASAFSVAFKRVANHIISTWIESRRFSHWQAFLTPTGYAATNNPIETYHHTLKLVNDSKRATPTELVNRLDLSRIAHVCSMTPFNDVPQVSKRLRAAYNRAEKKKELGAELVHRIQDRDLVLVRVSKVSFSAETQYDAVSTSGVAVDAPAHDTFSYESANLTRKTWEDMPDGGWIVDATGRSCMCARWWKAGICMHVIKATNFADLPCPGMPPPVLRFQTPSQPRAARNRQGRAQNTAPEVEPIPEGAIVFGPPSRASDYGRVDEQVQVLPDSVGEDRAVAVLTSATREVTVMHPERLPVRPRSAVVRANRMPDFVSQNEVTAPTHQSSDFVDNNATTQVETSYSRTTDSELEGGSIATGEPARRSSRRRVPTARVRESYALQKRRRTET